MREQRFEVQGQGQDTCERAPPQHSSSPSRRSYTLQRHGENGWKSGMRDNERQRREKVEIHQGMQGERRERDTGPKKILMENMMEGRRAKPF